MKPQNCKHWFIFESPNGVQSEGVCKFCGAREKAFNSLARDRQPKIRKGSAIHCSLNLKMLPLNRGFYLQGTSRYTNGIKDMEAPFFVDRE